MFSLNYKVCSILWTTLIYSARSPTCMPEDPGVSATQEMETGGVQFKSAACDIWVCWTLGGMGATISFKGFKIIHKKEKRVWPLGLLSYWQDLCPLTPLCGTVLPCINFQLGLLISLGTKKEITFSSTVTSISATCHLSLLLLTSEWAQK